LKMLNGFCNCVTPELTKIRRAPGAEYLAVTLTFGVHC